MQTFIVLCVSFLLSFYFYLIPVPELFIDFKPQWVVLTFIYWSLALPHRIGVLITVGLGLILDITEGSIFGWHAIALLFVHFICVFGYRRFRVFTVFQQCLLIFGITSIYLLICYWLSTIVKQTASDIGFLGSAVSSALMWPAVFSILRFFRRRYKIK